MRRLTIAASAAVMVLTAAQGAQAAITYDFVAVGSFDGRFTGDFRLTLDMPPVVDVTPGGDPLPTEVQAADMESCHAVLDGQAMTCAKAVFTPNYNWGGNIFTDAIDLYFTGSPDVESYGYQFAVGSFLHARHAAALNMSSILGENGDPGETTGYLSTGVPEPSVWSALIAGFAAVGVALRRRRAGLQAAL